ncbi:MAG TPA: type II CAAX endopeptidase family protein [Chitinophagaceae bacterium]|nr:type II CAAX endopeptidase family protein [Chitinophagaceae bacterium]
MTGILVQLAISFLLIYFIEKKDLSVLGFKPTIPRMTDLFLFMTISAFFSATAYWLREFFGNEAWKLNPNFSLMLLIDGIWWNIKSVMFEELIFRGVIFYILMIRIGVWKAILISSVAFGIYHWFSYNILGNPVQMIYVFIFTALAGLLYAYAYARTGSLYAPIAMHFGWNFTKIFIFSDGPIGDGLLIRTVIGPDVTVSYAIYYLISLGPVIFFLIVNFALVKFRKRVVPGIEFGKSTR